MIMKQLITFALASAMFFVLSSFGIATSRTTEKPTYEKYMEKATPSTPAKNILTIAIIGDVSSPHAVASVQQLTKAGYDVILIGCDQGAYAQKLKDNSEFKEPPMLFDVTVQNVLPAARCVSYPVPVNEGKLDNRILSFGQYWRNINTSQSLKL